MSAFSEVHYSGPMITKASKAIIMLHGRGGSSKSMLGLAERLSDETFYIALPQAENSSWYPYSFLEEESLNEPYLSSSLQSVKELIDQIAEHIPIEKIYIVGFSQGACLSLEVSAKFATRYGGIIAFTGGLIGKTLDARKYQGNFEGTKVFMSNGDQDPHIPLERSKASKAFLEKLGASVALKVYPGRSHTISEDEILQAKKIFKDQNANYPSAE